MVGLQSGEASNHLSRLAFGCSVQVPFYVGSG